MSDTVMAHYVDHVSIAVRSAEKAEENFKKSRSTVTRNHTA